jgi:lysozyme
MAPPYQLKLPTIVDVYQGEFPIKWDKMNPKPYRAILQATKGQFWEDEKCATYIEECNARGIKYGLYHFLFPNNIEQQADNFIQRVIELGGLGHFPPVIDVEFEPKKMKKGQVDNLPRGKAWGDQVKVCLDRLEAHFHEKPMIYTNRNFWNFTHDGKGNPPAWTNDYPLWIGWYPHRTSVDKNNVPRADRMPKGFDKFALWQYSESGRTDGYFANDLNVITPEYMAELDARFP